MIKNKQPFFRKILQSIKLTGCWPYLIEIKAGIKISAYHPYQLFQTNPFNLNDRCSEANGGI